MSGSTGRIGWTYVAALLASLALSGAAFAVAETEPAGSGEQGIAAGDEESAAGQAEPVADPGGSGEPGRVARSSFTTAIVDREPRDTVTELANDQQELAYFTELHGLEGHTVVHRWEYGDQVMAEVGFEVDGPRWRVHSTKRLDPSWVGTWRVSVLADGQVLTREEFEYTPAASGAVSREELPQATEATPASPSPE